MMEMCEHLCNQKEIALDLEFDSERFFHDCTALIQILSHEFDFIIDPFLCFSCCKSLSCSVLQNPMILKVVFSENDIRPLQRDFESFLVGAVDSQDVRASFLGLPQKKSFANVVQEILGIQIDKKYQFFPWVNSPLTPEMIEYA
jgi:ribonuclease D